MVLGANVVSIIAGNNVMSDRKETLKQIAEGFDIDIVYAFGSHAKDAVRWIAMELAELKVPSFSDVDIGVKPPFGKGLSAREKVELIIALEDFFSVNRVDLIVIPEADPFLAANIIRGERLFTRDEYEADEYDLYILRRAGDLAPFEKQRISFILGEDL